MNPREQEFLAIEKLREDYQLDGFEILPENRSFSVGGYVPDLVARKDDRIVLIEVKTRRTPSIENHLERLKDKIEAETGYEMHIYYLNGMELPKGPKIQTNASIDTVLDEAQRASSNGQCRAAFLIAWAALEAASRRIFPEKLGGSQTPGRIVSILSEEGIITPSQATELRTFAQMRNTLVHGELNVAIRQDDVSLMLERVKQVQHHTSPPERS